VMPQSQVLTFGVISVILGTGGASGGIQVVRQSP